MRNAIIGAFLLCAGSTPSGGFWHGVTGPTPHIGMAATRIFVPDGTDVATTQAMSRTGHYARSALTSLKIVSPNFNDGGTVPGVTASVKASVEYPAGVCTAITFGGGSTGTIANNSFLLSDSVSVTIPNGAQFWIRQFWQGANGTMSVSNHSDPSTMGDALDTAASGLTDKTVSCAAVTNTATGHTLPPAAIVASIIVPSVCNVGNSLEYGVGDSYSGSSGDIGGVDRSIGGVFAYTGVGFGGNTAFAFSQNPQPAITTLINSYCTHVISEFGSNDIYVRGDSVATLKTSLTTLYALYPGKTIFQTTITPRTTSSDSWATLVNQTIVSGDTSRVTFNTDLRAGTFGPNGGKFDLTAALESSQDSGKWKVGGPCSPWTADGIHPNPCGYLQIQSSGVIDTSRIHYP